MILRDLKIPYFKGIPQTWEHSESDELRENEPFKAVLVIVGFNRGRSSTTMTLVHTQDLRRFEEGNKSREPLITYSVFVSDMMDIITNAHEGCVGGTWCFCKKGSNFGLKLLNTNH